MPPKRFLIDLARIYEFGLVSTLIAPTLQESQHNVGLAMQGFKSGGKTAQQQVCQRRA
jgi:hypothetical protein